MIEVKIVADSMSPSGVRLTTFVLTYPRFIHSEFMTHRVFSRNASSSRAIPVKKQIEMIKNNPAIPLAFLKNQKGMQGGAKLEDQDAAVATWIEGRDRAVEIAEKFVLLDVHKQYANRVLEPYAHISVVCTSTEFDNFFALRIHKDAQPEIAEVGKKMYDCYESSKPKQLVDGMWHLPFAGGAGWSDLSEKECIKCSVARCARVSYLTHEGKEPVFEDDFKLYDRLLGGNPIHASPAEHQAMAVSDPNVHSGNFRGWIQYRKTLKNENITKYVSAPNLQIMKILFLDFDGVIHPITFHHSASGFSKAACENVQAILTKEPSVRIVISSAWRRNGLEVCRGILKENGVDPTKVIGITDAEGGFPPEHREEQISRWLKDHPEVKNFVVLDDSPLPKFKDRYVKINSYVGLTQKDTEIALGILCK